MSDLEDQNGDTYTYSSYSGAYRNDRTGDCYDCDSSGNLTPHSSGSGTWFFEREDSTYSRTKRDFFDWLGKSSSNSSSTSAVYMPPYNGEHTGHLMGFIIFSVLLIALGFGYWYFNDFDNTIGGVLVVGIVGVVGASVLSGVYFDSGPCGIVTIVAQIGTLILAFVIPGNDVIICSIVMASNLIFLSGVAYADALSKGYNAKIGVLHTLVFTLLMSAFVYLSFDSLSYDVENIIMIIAFAIIGFAVDIFSSKESVGWGGACAVALPAIAVFLGLTGLYISNGEWIIEYCESQYFFLLMLADVVLYLISFKYLPKKN